MTLETGRSNDGELKGEAQGASSDRAYAALTGLGNMRLPNSPTLQRALELFISESQRNLITGNQPDPDRLQALTRDIALGKIKDLDS